jgi:hypothetical protein
MQLSNEEVVVRMQRYLRQPLSCLAGLAGTRGLDARPARPARPACPPLRAQRAMPVFLGTLIEPLGDSLLSGYHAKGDSEWSHLHNALCRAIAGYAAQAHVSAVIEGGRVRGTKKKPGDVRFAGDVGAHGWAAAGSNELWVDVTVVSPLGSSYLSAASAARGSAASAAAKHKHTKYRNDIPGHVHFLPFPFESEGYHCVELERLLLGFAYKRTIGLSPAEAKTTARRWLSYWLDQLAVVHARYIARCLYNRASACKDAGNPSFRPVSTLDADDAHSSLPPPPPPPSPEMLRAAAAAAAAAFGLA